MGYVAAATAIVSAAYGIYSGERQSSEARKGRRRQQQAQQASIARQTSTAARSRGREEQIRRGRQLAIAGAAGSRTATPIDRISNPAASPTPSRTLG